MLRILLLFTVIYTVLCSDGDRSPFYINCVKGCMKANCTNDLTFTPEAAQQQDIWSKILLWNCRDECRYHCMWRTVQGFLERGYTIPKFHGKWPFKRILGVQEPASTLASLLNLAAHVYMFTEMKRQLPAASRTPALLLWKVFAVVCMHAWIWSAIFHTRDNAFTEFMDYACALSMVMSLFLAAILRYGFIENI
ncbi:post-GPI attachment to proteins factor 3 isoform X2 [Leptidea sinapis]|uniref:post-GPI attachment to proteins factor 3 isoform X2 n=1 Tax=Leptidea sinapis TaxID=189913 RepID=UPI0021273A11|nr:post-GPI attachment to proteins factor 3 isoform X2 [Leptidea sinapis]